MKHKAKHLLGKKNKNSPWVWGRRPQTQGEFFFLAQNMLRLSGQAAQELQEAQKLHAQRLVFSCIKFFGGNYNIWTKNMNCTLICKKNKILHRNMQKNIILHKNMQCILICKKLKLCMRISKLNNKKKTIMEKILILHNYIQNIGIQSHI